MSLAQHLCLYSCALIQEAQGLWREVKEDRRHLHLTAELSEHLCHPPAEWVRHYVARPVNVLQPQLPPQAEELWKVAGCGMYVLHDGASSPVILQHQRRAKGVHF